MLSSALSVDLEEYFHVSNFSGVISSDRWETLPSRVEAATHRLLDLFDERGSRATFFALGWVADRRPALLREILRRGHELACHGYAHELVYEIGPERFREDVSRARRAIEDATGRTPLGYRAPSYSVTGRSLWALGILAEEGFQYDSSIFPVRHPRYGIPDFPRRPLQLELGRGLSIAEFPPTAARVGRWSLPVAGGAYLRFLPPPLFRWGLRRVLRAGAPVLLYVHPWEIDASQPRVRARWRVRLNHYHNLERTEERLRRCLRLARFRPLAEVLGELRATGRLDVRPVEATLGAERRSRPATWTRIPVENP
jgi:polysaccharide deacetylase family protein (PEP-CTERM system associated)